MPRRIALPLALGLALALGACDSTIQEQLGVAKRAPDEFQVVRRAPLVIPPSYNLRPPAPGTVGPAQSTAAEAEQLLTGEPAPPAAGAPGQSAAEVALLNASPVRAETDVRERVADETGELARLNERTFLFILDFQRRQFQPQTDTSLLNPDAETARLKGAGVNPGVAINRTGSAPLTAPPPAPPAS